jgi:hypothetical protein
MEKKICTKCLIEKSLDEYYNRSDSKDRKRPYCKICSRIDSKKYRKPNIKEIKDKPKNNSKSISEESKAKRKQYKLNNKEKLKIARKKHFELNKDRIKAIAKKWRETNRDKLNNDYNQKRLTDSLFKLKCNIRNLIKMSIKRNGYTKKSRTAIILDCSVVEFKLYLEAQFLPWMNWDNYGKYKKGCFNYGWDIDHRVPTSSAVTEEELIKLNHYSNLQPLCSKVNRDIKRDTIHY